MGLTTGNDPATFMQTPYAGATTGRSKRRWSGSRRASATASSPGTSAPVASTEAHDANCVGGAHGVCGFNAADSALRRVRSSDRAAVPAVAGGW
jgi:hypothetical protein